VLNEYQEKIEDTMSDLTEHLRKVDARLQALLAQRIDDAEESETERHNLRSEHESIQQCMNICTDVAAHIDLVRPKIVPYMSSHDDRQVITTTAAFGVSAQRDTEQVLGRCKDDLTSVLSQLRTRLHEVSQRQNILSHQHTIPADQEDDQKRLQEELESIKQSLSICEEASQKAKPDRTNVFEEITMADDGHQIMVSTFGDLICARKITAGARSVQWFGQMSDESLQELSQKRGESSFKRSS
jgi:predicted  nucleic acid-binding Zn-ribbon protein